jgi:hypothetical protein
MTYTSFEDFYKEAKIHHLVIWEDNGALISPPFCTDKCKDYSKVMILKDKLEFIDVDTPLATSKFNAMARINDSLWFVPYGIWDQFNVVLEIKNNKPITHYINSSSKGQFYNLASNGTSAFSAPLGYDTVSFALFIKNGIIKQIPMPDNSELKKHMGVIFHNGHYWSPPRGEGYDYNQILKFNPDTEKLSFIEADIPKSRRKYSDFIIAGDKLFALPLGRDFELKHMLIIDTLTDVVELVDLNVPKFVKKYNAGVLLEDTIVAMPYGHKDDKENNFGLLFNTKTYEHSNFNVGQEFGGKYRFRSGVEFNNLAVFFPTGSPNVEIIAVDIIGNIIWKKLFKEYIFGRPIVYNNKATTIAYHIETKKHYIFSLKSNFETDFILLY